MANPYQRLLPDRSNTSGYRPAIPRPSYGGTIRPRQPVFGRPRPMPGQGGPLRPRPPAYGRPSLRPDRRGFNTRNLLNARKMRQDRRAARRMQRAGVSGRERPFVNSMERINHAFGQNANANQPNRAYQDRANASQQLTAQLQGQKGASGVSRTPSAAAQMSRTSQQAQRNSQRMGYQGNSARQSPFARLRRGY